MENPILIVDYDKRYSESLNRIDSQQWGNYENEVIEDYLTPDRIFKVALYDKVPVGFAFGRFDKDNFEVETICVHKDYWRLGIGTALLDALLVYAKEKNVKKFYSYLVHVNNHTNSAKLFSNKGFKHVRDIENYWGNLDKTYFCTECNKRPCVCTAELWVKEE